MPSTILIADSGATKCEWCLLSPKRKTILTQGMSPYFLGEKEMSGLLEKELNPSISRQNITHVFFYGTGCANKQNAATVKKALEKNFPTAAVTVNHDLFGAARSLCGHEKGIACILGTGSNSCFYDGKKILRNSPGLGYVLGDEGSGAYLGKKVLQYYLYDVFDEGLKARFDLAYTTNAEEILENIYKKALPNRYLAGFTRFLADNRGHYMIENIIEDGLNDFFHTHLSRFKEISVCPVHFTGGVSFVFQDIIRQLCEDYDFNLGKILKNPMEGLIAYHQPSKQ